ncbi:MAG: hypothetical protein C0403_10000 [Desulfobacterium sp.]|nr:hypothetical protein [Desulfobacterium sp.]
MIQSNQFRLRLSNILFVRIPGYIVVNIMGIGFQTNTSFIWLTVQFGRLASLLTYYVLFVKKKNCFFSLTFGKPVDTLPEDHYVAF